MAGPHLWRMCAPVGAACCAASLRRRNDPYAQGALPEPCPPPSPVVAPCAHGLAPSAHEVDDLMAQHRETERQLQKQADKARMRAQERVKWTNEEMLGMTPKLWIEALDEQHRYGSLLYPYWQRWESSRTRMMFFEWLDYGRGALIDLERCPRRHLEEGALIYLSRTEVKLFEVRIEKGRFVWCCDGDLVTLPTPRDAPLATPRAVAVKKLVDTALDLSLKREKLITTARAAAQAALRSGADATPEALEAVCAPLVEEGLLRMIRDPFFKHRQAARPTDELTDEYVRIWGDYKEWSRKDPSRPPKTPMYAIPKTLKPNVTWTSVLHALDHEEGSGMKEPIPTVEERLTPKKPGKGGVFVVDQFGKIFMSQKIPGAFHHSSFTCGHCCKFAGALSVENGMIKTLMPHSGHYVPTQQDYDEIILKWKAAGLDLSQAEIRGLVKKE